MKVKRKLALELYAVLSQAQNVFGKPITGRFRYAVAVNQKICEEERKMVIEAFPFDPGFIEYDQKRVAILRETGINNQFDLEKLTPEDREALDGRLIKLREEYLSAIQAQENIDKERDEFCKEEIDLELRTIGINDIPEIIASNDWEISQILMQIVDPNKE